MGPHTHGGNNLRLHPVLVLETASEVAYTPLAVPCDIRDLANVIKHVAAGEKENGDEADSSPHVAVRRKGPGVGPEHVDQGADAGGNDQTKGPGEVVKGSLDSWVWAVGGVTDKPIADLLGGLGAVGEVVAEWLGGGDGVRADSGWEEEEDGGGLEAQLRENRIST